MCREPLREIRLLVEQADHGCFLQPHDRASLNCGGRRHAPGLTSQAPLAKEIADPKNCDNGFFSLLGKYGQRHSAFLDVENSIRGLLLRKDNLISLIGGYRPSPVCFGEKV